MSDKINKLFIQFSQAPKGAFLLHFSMSFPRIKNKILKNVKIYLISEKKLKKKCKI